MNILLIGSGGREHALAWKIAQSSRCNRLYIAPGNAGTLQHGSNVHMDINDFAAIGRFCRTEKISMVVVGPEEPLVKGIVDFFEKDPHLVSIPVIGPGASGARLEGSKAFAKQFMQQQGIPTAAYREFTADNYQEGIDYLKQHPLPVVLKADGLAAGKGVLICQSHEEALDGFENMIRDRKFGDAGAKVVVEAFLSGIELSVFILTDGENYVLLPEAKDYKRIGEGDTGNNTGGMGAISPVPFVGKAFMQKVDEQIIRPTVSGLKQQGIPYRGFIFFGLINVEGDPFVIEYNCRMGDPETEVVIPRLKNDLVELFDAVAQGRLNTITIETDERPAAAVMAVSGGYPEAYEKGFVISGLATTSADSRIFHAGTKMEHDQVVTSGGRVLCVSSFGESVGDAVAKSVKVLENISYTGMNYRKDIGYEFE